MSAFIAFMRILLYKKKLIPGNAALSALPTVVTGPEQPIPGDFSAFLELNLNKKEFVQFLVKQLSAEAPYCYMKIKF